MREILIFAGTTEGRELSEQLVRAGICHVLCVATQYGEIVLKSNPLVKVHRGRMDREEIKDFILKGNFAAVVDATHPYAREVTQNIRGAMEGIELPYLRLKRGPLSPGAGEENCPEKEREGIIWFDTREACVEALRSTSGNILLTTGSKDLSLYCSFEEIKSRLYVRVLPGMESLSACVEQGICGKQIIAMQGPFTEQMNEATIRQYGITCLVTKESGRTGGFWEKLRAAEKTGTQVFVIGRPGEENGYSFLEVCRKLEGFCGQAIIPQNALEITLAGVGMGSKGSLTREVQEAIEEADILLGAERMLEPYQPKLEKRPYYQGNQIIPYLEEVQEKICFPGMGKVAVLFSGDSGFYSGCEQLHLDLKREIDAGRLKASVRILPGISSIAALASRIGESYQDAAIYSMHGKELPGLIRRIKRNPKTFLLMSGVKDMNRLGCLLEKAGMPECEVTAGYQLSYEEEQVIKCSPKECRELKKEGLYACMVSNPHAEKERLTHGRADKEFIRERIPMTKEEVREISICKLQLYRGAVVYDIGSGTGSVATEIAGLSEEIQVYAIERKREAVSLIERNKEKFGLDNLTVVEGEAPWGLSHLPGATHAFIGGSGGQLKAILEELYRINPQIRVVVNAVSMETFCEIRECLAEERIRNKEIVQVQVSRVREMGNYHLMQAENPVWICAFGGQQPDGREA